MRANAGSIAAAIAWAWAPAAAIAVPFGSSEARHVTRTVDGDVGPLGPVAIGFVLCVGLLAVAAFVASRVKVRRPDWADEPVRGGRAAQIERERQDRA